MSKDNVKKMFGKMEKDAALKAKYAQLMQAHQEDAENKMAEKLIELGKTSGFAFSKDDLLAARSEVMDNANSNKELSDDDLAGVAGGAGKKMSVIASIFSVGIACIIASFSDEKNEKGSCGMRITKACA